MIQTIRKMWTQVITTPTWMSGLCFGFVLGMIVTNIVMYVRGVQWP